MESYFDHLLTKHNFEELKPKSTPFPPGLVLFSLFKARKIDCLWWSMDKPYREIVGALLFAVAACRPDISFATNLLSRFSSNPGHSH